MHLYLLRHGVAEPYRFGEPDSARVLTPEGIRKMQTAAQGMAKTQLTWDTIYSSPYPRALETARIVQQTLQLPPVQITPEMSAGAFRLETLQTLTKRATPNSRLLFVGHEPDLSTLIRNLTGAQAEMKKGALAYIEAWRVEPNAGVLHFLLPPKHLRSLISPTLEEEE